MVNRSLRFYRETVFAHEFFFDIGNVVDSLSNQYVGVASALKDGMVLGGNLPDSLSEYLYHGHDEGYDYEDVGHDDDSTGTEKYTDGQVANEKSTTTETN